MTNQEKEFFTPILLEYGKQYGMTMFGADILRGHDGNYYLIDVNYFPSYNGIPPAAIKEAMRNIYLKKMSS